MVNMNVPDCVLILYQLGKDNFSYFFWPAVLDSMNVAETVELPAEPARKRAKIYRGKAKLKKPWCLQHLWYVSTDLQIFMFIAFPLTLLLLKYPKTSQVIGVIVAVAFCIMTCLQTHSWNLFYALKRRIK
ncbi:hypothetical protein MRX96_025952 [Rhipicephalus microplus]